MTNERKVNWNYPLVTTSENKSGKRTSTPRGFSYEAIGVDFSIKGGLRPFPGFSQVHEFKNLELIAHHSSIAHDVIDIFPISFRIDIDQYGYGFIYRVVQTGTDTGNSAVVEDLANVAIDAGTFTGGAIGVQATLEITVTGNPVLDQSITLISTDGTSIEYTAKNAQDVTENEFLRTGTDEVVATSLGDCIIATDGHKGKMTVSTNGSGVLTVTQVVEGAGVDTNKADIYIDYYIKDHNSDEFTRSSQIKKYTDKTAPMDVVTFGRYVYILVKGQEPVLFYLNYEVPEGASGILSVNSYLDIFEFGDSNQPWSTSAASAELYLSTATFTGGTPTVGATAVAKVVGVDLSNWDTKTFTVKSTDLTEIVYTFDKDTAYDDDDVPSIGLLGATTHKNISDNIKDAIESANGHDGKITIVQSTSPNADDTLTMTQVATAGSVGSLVIRDTNDREYTLTATTGSQTNLTTTSTTGTFQVVTDNDTTAGNIISCISPSTAFSAEEGSAANKISLTQALDGVAGNTIITLTMANAGAMSKSNFAGGLGIHGTDYEEVVETDTGPGIQPEIVSADDATAIDSLPVPSSNAPAIGHVFTVDTVGSHWDTVPDTQVQTEVADLKAGNYAVAYVLEDPDTGRKTSLSEIAQVKQEHLTTRATGKITVANQVPSTLDGIIITIDDGINTAVVFTLDDDVADSTGTGAAYNVAIPTPQTYASIALKIATDINTANTNGDLKITAAQAAADDDFITLTHDDSSLIGNKVMTTGDELGHIVVEGMAGAEEFDPGNIGIEIVYDSSKFTKAYIYRSVRVQDAGGSYSASVVQLDKIITLLDYSETSQTGMTGNYKRSVYYFTLEDLALIYQDPYVDNSTFDENMPKAGAGVEFDGILLTSNIFGDSSTSVSNDDRPLDRYRGLGEFRWSAIRETNPELFPPENYYVPSKIANQVIMFERSGGAILGFANNVIMHISRESSGVINYLKVLPIHEGYGTVNKRAVKSVGPRTYFVNDKGVKSVDAQGRLDSLHALDGIIDDWKTEFSYLSMGYDSQSSVLYILNSNQGKAAMMWFSTSMVSELHDLPFSIVKTGQWPSDKADIDSDLTERAFFLQNPSQTLVPPRVWVVDAKREDVIAGSSSTAFNGEKRITLLHGAGGGDTRFTVDTGSDSGNFVTIEDTDLTEHGDGSTRVVSNIVGTTTDSALSSFYNFSGAWMYIISSSTEANIGSKAQIKYRHQTTNKIYYENEDATFVPAEGDRIAISPIIVKWGGALFGHSEMVDPKEMNPVGLHSVRLADAASAYFAEVSGAMSKDTLNPTDLIYKISIFEGDSDTAKSTGIPKDITGTIIKSVNVGEATNWASFKDNSSTTFLGAHGVQGTALSPGIELLCPDLDFRILSVIIEGKILPTLRTERAT